MTCSQQWLDLPAWGTAPVARFWVALEQPGPWGARAITQSELDPELGGQLTRLVEGAGGRLVLVRDPRSHASGKPGPRTVLVAGGTPNAPWLGRTLLTDPVQLVALLEEWTAGDLRAMPGWLEPCAPVLLVCTNGKRDQCCAVRSRPVVNALAAECGGAVWESSHLNGHRYAATALALPSSQLVARLDPDLGRRLLERTTPLPLGERHDRGRTLLDEPVQVADAWLRAREPQREAAGLRFQGPDGLGVVTITDEGDGSEHRVRVLRRTLEQELPKSCGKEPEPAVVWLAEPA